METLFEKELQSPKPSNFEQSGEIKSINPRAKFEVVKDVNRHIEQLKGMSSYMGKEYSNGQLEELMEVWLHGLDQSVPPHFTNLK